MKKTKKRRLKKWVLYYIFMALLGGFMALIGGLELMASDGASLYLKSAIINYIIFTAFISLIKKNIKAIIKREEEEGGRVKKRV